jgi:hypothetical protein
MDKTTFCLLSLGRDVTWRRRKGKGKVTRRKNGLKGRWDETERKEEKKVFCWRAI